MGYLQKYCLEHRLNESPIAKILIRGIWKEGNKVSGGKKENLFHEIESLPF